MLASVAVVSVGLIGCGSGDETARIKLVPVSGTVTHNGKPLEGAQITFSPEADNQVATPGGDVTGPQGNYKAMFRGRFGLAPGKYKVLVSKTILPPGVQVGDDPIMAQIAAESRGASRPGEAAVTQLKGEFEREVPPDGAILDCDVKANPTPVTPSNR